MTRAILLVVLGLAASALARPQDTPQFNPSEADNFASTGPADFGATSVPPAATFTDEFSVSIPTELASTTPSGRPTGSPSPSTTAASSRASSSGSASESASTTPSATTTTESTSPSSTESTPAGASDTGAARANFPEYIGAIGLVAGLALF